MTVLIKAPKKLIEVALPLDAINVAAAREKSIRHGHPSTLHLWWARRPLAAARAVIFAQLVNDPSWKWELEHPGEIPPNNLKASWAAARKHLFNLIEDLVQWENSTNEEVLEKARKKIRESWLEVCELNREHPEAATLFNPDEMPGLHDPFAGGGAIPLEAQRLGLKAYASDLNPVAVTINKAMIEIPPRFAGVAPVGPMADGSRELFERNWKGAQGLAEDVRRYGLWVRDEAEKRIGHLYPKVTITHEMSRERPDLRGLEGKELVVIAWIWARTVKSPNPAFSHVDVPLASTFVLSSKKGNEAWIEPVVEGDRYWFRVRVGKYGEGVLKGTKSGGSGSSFLCLLSNVPMEFGYLRDEAKAHRMGHRLMAIVCEGKGGRLYLSPDALHESRALEAHPGWRPNTPLPERALGFRVQEYGMLTWDSLFTNRQLVALTTFSDLVSEVRTKIEADARVAGMDGDETGLDAGGKGAKAYAEAVGVYLAFAVDKCADYWSTICSWIAPRDTIRSTFGRQAIPMVWDYAEVNPLSDSTGNVSAALEWICKCIQSFPAKLAGSVEQIDAQKQNLSLKQFISTDPPYYDNIGYADLSDFFYVWLRKSIKDTYPKLFSTIAVPKAEELVATPYRHGSKKEAEVFFLSGMTDAMSKLSRQAHESAPISIYYAFKQSETKSETGTNSTGWITFLEAVNQAGLALTGTWPMRTEKDGRMIGNNTNALASSIILICRPRPANAPTTSRRAFIRELNQILPEALDEMTRGSGSEHSPVAPVDLSQAIIGPGMAIYSKYSAVLEADGSPMSVKTALELINRFLAEDDFDGDTQFCLHWFEQYGWKDGVFGEADTLARAKGTSVQGVQSSGVIDANGGKVRVLKWSEYPSTWDPSQDNRLPVWEGLHHLIRVFARDGETGAARLLAPMITKSEAIRQLAYRLYTLCERKGWAEDARAYNEIITSWAAIETAVGKLSEPVQSSLAGIV
jgi:putative DNA methylase